jgi:hypothetical protein
MNVMLPSLQPIVFYGVMEEKGIDLSPIAERPQTPSSQNSLPVHR